MDKLEEMRSMWIGKYVTITNRSVRDDGTDDSAAGVVIDIQMSGRKLGRIGYHYWISLDWGGGIPWSETTEIEETAR